MFFVNIKSILIISLILLYSVNNIYGQKDDEDVDEDTDGDSDSDDDSSDDGTDGQEDSDPSESTTTEMTTTTERTTTAKTKNNRRRQKTTTPKTTTTEMTTTTTTKATTTTPKPKVNKPKKTSKPITKEEEEKEKESNDYSDDEDQDYEEEEEENNDDYYEEMSREDLLKSLIQRSFSTNDIDVNALRNQSIDQKWIEFVSQIDNNLQSLMRSITPTALDVFYSVPELSASCSNSLLRISSGVQTLQEWAAKMIDSNGKFPTGLMSGTLSSLGAYDQCLETVATDEGQEIFRGQYCILKMRPPMPLKKGRLNYYTPYVSLNGSKYGNTWIDRRVAGKYATGFYSVHVYNGLCLPSTCSSTDMNSILKKYIGDYFEVSIDYCDQRQDKNDFKAIVSRLNVSQRIAISVITLSASLVFIATLFEYFCPDFVKDWPSGRLIACFSMISNFKKLFRIDRMKMDQNLGFVHGIRVLTMIWIIAIHTFTVGTLFVPMLVYRFEDEARTFGKQLSTQFIFNGYISVSNFFFLSGVVAAYISLPMFKERVPSLFSYIALRWFRFVPSLIGIISFHMVWPLLGSGPVFKEIAAQLTEPCTRNWWTNLLFINNWLILPDMCLVHTWFLSADFQLHVISFFVILALSRSRNIGILLSIALILCGIAIPSVVNLKTNGPPIPMPFEEPDIDQFYRDLNTLYHPTYNHLSTYFIGILVGYLLMATRKTNIKINIPLKLIFWTILPMLTLSATFATYLWTGLELEYSAMTAAAYSGLHRLVYILSYVWIAIYCANNHKSLITRFLSSDFFIPLSRLSFSVYLTHLLIVWYFVLETRQLIRFTYTDFIYSTGGVILYSMVASLVLYFLFESVWSNVLHLMLKKPSTLTTNDRKGDENRSKSSETTNGRTGRTNETDFTIYSMNREFGTTNGTNKWSANGYQSKDLNANFDEYRVVSMSSTAGNVYVDVAQVGHKTSADPSLGDNRAVRKTKL